MTEEQIQATMENDAATNKRKRKPKRKK